MGGATMALSQHECQSRSRVGLECAISASRNPETAHPPPPTCCGPQAQAGSARAPLGPGRLMESCCLKKVKGLVTSRCCALGKDNHDLVMGASSASLCHESSGSTGRAAKKPPPASFPLPIPYPHSSSWSPAHVLQHAASEGMAMGQGHQKPLVPRDDGRRR